ncbi:N-acetylglucosamine kinase [Streptomyces huiliensis]|uniref:N-acetylglucosamine kinase n=1 Tax=Streptomyces huiliensis TaxID=2876027 RepID=UPI003556602F
MELTPRRRPPRSSARVLAVDSGGSGVRVAVAPTEGDGPVLTWSSPEPVPVGDRGIDARVLLDRILPPARELLERAGVEHCAAGCVGAAGMVALGADLRAVLPGALRAELGVRRLALASDAVTAYAGAVGQRPGVVVAAGTGLVALGTGLVPGGGWRRADGWGHLLGDCGGGAWIGRAGLEAALRAYDGRAGGSTALLGRLEAVFGPAPDLPEALYPRPDRAAVLASFAPEVGRCAAACPVAADILRTAARHIAEAAAAAFPPMSRPPAGGAGQAAVRGTRGGSAGPYAADASDARGASDVTDASEATRTTDVTGARSGPGVSDGADASYAAGVSDDAAHPDRPADRPAERAAAPWRQPPVVALTGGLAGIGPPLLLPLRQELRKQLPYARQVPAEGSPLDGAARIAAALVTGRLLLPVDGSLLRVASGAAPAASPGHTFG